MTALRQRAPVHPTRPVGPGVAGAADRSWDPLIRPIAHVFLVLALILNADAVGGITGVLIPNTIPLFVGLACIGMAIILPREGRVVIPIAPMALVGCAVLSYLWTANPDATMLWLRSYALVTVGIAALALVLPNREVFSLLVWFVRIVLVITLFAVITDPLARVHIDPLGEAPDLKGWHGFFIHKNVMAAFLVFALPVTLEFDRSAISKVLSVTAIAVLFVGSDSTTGRAAALVVVALKLWLIANRRLTSNRSTVALVVSTAALLSFVGVAIGFSLAALADAAGKDLTFTGRTRIWTATWHAILERPVLGHGINGLYRPPITAETQKVLSEIGFKAGHPHNGLMDTGAQLGAVGVVIVLAVLVSLIRWSLRLQQRNPRVAAWGLGATTAIIVMSVGESAFLNASTALFAVLGACTLRALKASETGVQHRR